MLQLHHLNPEEKDSHKIWSWSQKRREAEIAKCIVLCWPCHIHYHVEARRKDSMPTIELDAEMILIMENLEKAFGR